MKKLLVFLTLFSALASAGTFSGTIQTPSGFGIANSTITLTLSQAGVVPASFSVVPSPFVCATDVNGVIRGIRNPLVGPALSQLGGGSLSGTYYVKIAYYNGGTLTAASPELSITLAAGSRLNIAAPVLQPTSSTGYKVYVSTIAGSETLEATTVGWSSTTLSTLAGSGASAPTANTTVCSFTFNDSILPSYTTYLTNVQDQVGNQVRGFPQKYFYQGTLVDISTLTPAGNLAVKFPVAIVANPALGALQSIAGPLTLNGNLTAPQIVSNVPTGTPPFLVSSATPVPTLVVQNLNSTTTINTANPIAEIWTNPAGPRSFTHPDPGGNWNYFYTPTPGAVDCTQSWIVCTMTIKAYFEAGGCNGVGAGYGWDTFPTNAPVAACFTGVNTVKGVLDFKAAVNLEQQKANNLNPVSATTITIPTITTTAGNLLIAVVAVNGAATVTGCNDGSAYTLAKRQQNGATLGVEVWYRQNASALSGATLTCTASGASVMALQFFEYSGAAAVALDQTQGGTGTGTSIASTATATTVQASELSFSAAAVAGTTVAQTAGAAFNAHTASTNTTAPGISAISEGSIMNATGTATGPMTIAVSATWASAIVTFKAASASAPTISAQRGYLLPADFVAPLNVNVVWTSANTPNTTTVSLGISTVCSAAAGSDDPAFNAATTATAAVNGANITSITAVPAVTITGCNAGNLFHEQIQRIAGSVNDNYEGAVRLYGLENTFTRAQ